jgi:hypothetical protein
MQGHEFFQSRHAAERQDDFVREADAAALAREARRGAGGAGRYRELLNTVAAQSRRVRRRRSPAAPVPGSDPGT